MISGVEVYMSPIAGDRRPQYAGYIRFDSGRHQSAVDRILSISCSHASLIYELRFPHGERDCISICNGIILDENIEP
jgi:hypothetical protein